MVGGGGGVGSVGGALMLSMAGTPQSVGVGKDISESSVRGGGGRGGGGGGGSGGGGRGGNRDPQGGVVNEGGVARTVLGTIGQLALVTQVWLGQWAALMIA